MPKRFIITAKNSSSDEIPERLIIRNINVLHDEVERLIDDSSIDNIEIRKL
jgi:hypothetical protein